MEEEKETKKQLAIVAIIFLLICVGLSGCFSEEIKSTDLSVGEIKDRAIEVDYEDLMRNIEDYEGKIVYFEGRVFGVTEDYDDSYDLLIHTGYSYYSYIGNDIWVNYKGKRILENDIVDIWGYVKGLKTYKTVLGAERTLPELDSFHLELIE